MEYEKTADGRYVQLKQRNVDTGMGLDRTLAVLYGYADIFQIETLSPLVVQVERLSGRRYLDSPKPFQVIVDHLRAATFAIADGALPSNVEAGYVVRRIVRRAVLRGSELGIHDNFCGGLSERVVDLFAPVYPELEKNRARIVEILDREEIKFKRTLERGLRQFDKVVERIRQRGGEKISGAEAFDLFETYGFPLPLTVELAHECGLAVEEAGFEALYAEHQKISRRGLEQKFKGGLADRAEETTRLHTATHLLHQALRQVLGAGVHQMGSNITSERLRFDFSWPEKLTTEQLDQVERMVNEQIEKDLPVSMEVMPLADALSAEALAFFGEKYGELVKVYSIGSFSKEVCGGPHANRTSELGRFKIVKEEAVGQGIRRIRAVLEKGI